LHSIFKEFEIATEKGFITEQIFRAKVNKDRQQYKKYFQFFVKIVSICFTKNKSKQFHVFGNKSLLDPIWPKRSRQYRIQQFD
jgi:hypothetical protein